VWEVVGTDEFAEWYGQLTDEQAGAVDARVDLLEATGPSLGRPTVETIKTSRHPNMKELRCSKDGVLRILFIFDPVRQAVLLLGGDKGEGARWNDWYLTAVPRADDLYDEYLQELRDEGLIP
jgi:hypothetical protein